jgi:hypothetical protein
MMFRLHSESDGFIARLRAGVEHDLADPRPTHPSNRLQQERLLALCTHVENVRRLLRDVYGASEDGTGSPALAWGHRVLPPSYELALERDRIRSLRGSSSVLDWKAVA